MRTSHDAEHHMPPGPRLTVQILRERGHAVAVRRTRTGSLRYAVDGRRETDAYTMAQRFRHYGI
ncbi:hypothetical protein [Microvirga massiliensis]|uniref:hypothetical protein n=1 Tax=Microvirga massiliensis TaxID=1033741 RepID=UPI00066068D8|nr:hypothetical protein [Microvirga massiliensis]